MWFRKKKKVVSQNIGGKYPGYFEKKMIESHQDDIDYLAKHGIKVLDLIVDPLDDYNFVFVVSNGDLGRLVDNFVEHRQPDNMGMSFIARGTDGKGNTHWSNATGSECNVETSRTLIGILHDCWYDDVDWWEGQSSYNDVDDYVIRNRIPDTPGNYARVMFEMTEIYGGEE